MTETKREKCLFQCQGARWTHTHVCGEWKGHPGAHQCGDCSRYFNIGHSWKE